MDQGYFRHHKTLPCARRVDWVLEQFFCHVIRLTNGQQRTTDGRVFFEINSVGQRGSMVFLIVEGGICILWGI